jgi:hypothetical protein
MDLKLEILLGVQVVEQELLEVQQVLEVLVGNILVLLAR